VGVERRCGDYFQIKLELKHHSDHDLDDPNQTQLNVFSGRGVLVESARGPVWLVGTASEHHASTPYGLHHSLTAPIQVIYQYAFSNAQNVYAGLIQTETPYFQPTPKPPVPFAINPTYGDPVDSKLDAWGLIITNSYNIYIYGAGLYSFFQVKSFLWFKTKSLLIYTRGIARQVFAMLPSTCSVNSSSGMQA
jgi:hypothetical protein